MDGWVVSSVSESAREIMSEETMVIKRVDAMPDRYESTMTWSSERRGWTVGSRTSKGRASMFEGPLRFRPWPSTCLASGDEAVTVPGNRTRPGTVGKDGLIASSEDLPCGLVNTTGLYCASLGGTGGRASMPTVDSCSMTV